MKTIKDAVIELGGKWHEGMNVTNGYYSGGCNHVHHIGTIRSEFSFTKEDFAAEDQRYKSAADVSENSKSNDFEINNNWHERGELPPVGTVCERLIIGTNQWSVVEVLYLGSERGMVKTLDSGYEQDITLKYNKFRPIRSERERVIYAANKIYYTSVDVDDFIENLVKAEMLVLPTESGNNKG